MYVDFDVSLTATTALVASNKYGSMTCAKFATAEYVCAYLEVVGDGAGTGKWTWSVYGKATAPATADFTSNQLPTHTSTGLGTLTTYYPIAKFDSLTGTSSTPAAKNTVTTGFLQDPDWGYWDATNNSISSDGKTIKGRIQYKSDKDSDANAIAVLTSLATWNGTTIVGAADVISGATKATYASANLASTATSNVSSTTTTTGAFALSTIASAIALVIAF